MQSASSMPSKGELPASLPVLRRNRPDSRSGIVINSFGTESCPFWDKVGACRHGHRCSKYHHKPKRSKTIVFWKIFRNPIRTVFLKSDDRDKNKDSHGEFVKKEIEIDESRLQREATRLYQDLFVEFALKYGEIESIVICGNYNPHVGGNVLVQFKDERSALQCFRDCNDRWYNGQPIFCELSPVVHIDDAICKDFPNDKCERGDQCNLIHARRPPYDLQRTLFASQRAHYKAQDNV